MTHSFPTRRVSDLLLVSGLKSEAFAFSHPVKADALRLDLLPYLQLDLEGASWYVRPQIAYRYTAYSLDNALALGGDAKPTRALPIASIDAEIGRASCRERVCQYV